MGSGLNILLLSIHTHSHILEVMIWKLGNLAHRGQGQKTLPIEKTEFSGGNGKSVCIIALAQVKLGDTSGIFFFGGN